jgi:hypothetical protein
MYFLKPGDPFLVDVLELNPIRKALKLHKYPDPETCILLWGSGSTLTKRTII